jgi:hypothetical protein
MALNWPGVDLLAVTTVADDQGRRAGYTKYALALAGREDVATQEMFNQHTIFSSALAPRSFPYQSPPKPL